MPLIRRIVSGLDGRKTRFHDLKGNRIDMAGLRFFPHCLISTIARCVFGVHQRRPWLGYRASRHLRNLIRPKWRILEFGSGMSTAWFASRCLEVVSVEHDKSWHERVSREFETQGIRNCDFRLVASNPDRCLEDYPNAYFDFALVDGIERRECVETALRKVRPSGWIYLDNTDFVPEAESLLLRKRPGLHAVFP